MFTTKFFKHTLPTCFAAALLLSASPVLAIPSSGNYEWTPGSPITGTFTSDGSKLTAFNFSAVSTTNVWTPLDTISTNDSLEFFARDTAQPPTNFNQEFVFIFWSPNPEDRIAPFVGIGISQPPADIPFRQIGTAPVPEPSTMLLLGSGLVGLIGFRMKKSRSQRMSSKRIDE